MLRNYIGCKGLQTVVIQIRLGGVRYFDVHHNWATNYKSNEISYFFGRVFDSQKMQSSVKRKVESVIFLKGKKTKNKK